jgi:hypothetical protein
MPTIRGALRSVVFAPSLTEVTWAKRGFPARPKAVAEHLEAIPQAVICGFEWGIEARDQWEVERRLNLVEPGLLGFAYEGATMAFTILDTMGPRGHRTRDLLNGPGRPHTLLAYIGMGFAMARLPRPLWRKMIPDLDGNEFYPIMTWLAVDGYGFDRAFFDTKRWVHSQHRPAPYPWDSDPDYFLRAVDQGIGRALWFIYGADPVAVDAAVRAFASERQADLWSGVGLAAAFAGGCTPAGLTRLSESAGQHQAELGQGAVFALRGRSAAGFVPEHSAAALSALAGLTVPAAMSLADDTRPANAVASAGRPPYEQWRAAIRARLAAADTGPARTASHH